MSGQGQQPNMTSGGGQYGGSGTRSDLNNHGNQCNPNHPTYQGHQSGYQGQGTPSDLKNHSNQMNPNNPSFQAKK